MDPNKSTCLIGDLEDIDMDPEQYQEYQLCEALFGYAYIAEVLGDPLKNSGLADLANDLEVNTDEDVPAGTLQQLGVGNSTVEVKGNGSHSVLQIMPSSHTIVPSSMCDVEDGETLQDDNDKNGTLKNQNLDVTSMALEGNHSYTTVQNRRSSDISYYFCSICGNGYNTAGPLKVHMRTCSRKKNRDSFDERRCELCRKLYSSAKSLRSHMKLHSNLEPLRCRLCLRRFFEKSLYSAHMNWHKRQDELHAKSLALTIQNGGKALVVKEYECSFCLQNFTAVFDIDQVKRRYVCDTCRNKYNNLPDQRQRNQRATCLYSCDLCGRQYANTGFLQVHRDTCNGVFKTRQNH